MTVDEGRRCNWLKKQTWKWKIHEKSEQINEVKQKKEECKRDFSRLHSYFLKEPSALISCCKVMVAWFDLVCWDGWPKPKRGLPLGGWTGKHLSHWQGQRGRCQAGESDPVILWMPRLLLMCSWLAFGSLATIWKVVLLARARSEAKEATWHLGLLGPWRWSTRAEKAEESAYFHVCDFFNIPLETFSVSRTKGLPNECSRYVEYHPHVACGGDCHQWVGDISRIGNG